MIWRPRDLNAQALISRFRKTEEMLSFGGVVKLMHGISLVLQCWAIVICRMCNVSFWRDGPPMTLRSRGAIPLLLLITPLSREAFGVCLLRRHSFAKRTMAPFQWPCWRPAPRWPPRPRFSHDGCRRSDELPRCPNGFPCVGSGNPTHSGGWKACVGNGNPPGAPGRRGGNRYGSIRLQRFAGSERGGRKKAEEASRKELALMDVGAHGSSDIRILDRGKTLLFRGGRAKNAAFSKLCQCIHAKKTARWAEGAAASSF